MNLAALERQACKQMVQMMMTGAEPPHSVAYPDLTATQFYTTKLLQVMKGLYQLNLPLHIVPFLIFKLKTLRTEGIVKPLLKLAINITRSVAFLTGYIMFFQIFQEWPRLPFIGPRLFHRDGLIPIYTRQMLANFMSAAAIAFEQPHRRVDITYYCLPRALEILWNLLKNRKLVRRDPPGLNAILIAVSFAIIAYKFSEEQETRPSQVRGQRDQGSISGFSLRVATALWGGHHTMQEKVATQVILDDTDT